MVKQIVLCINLSLIVITGKFVPKAVPVLGSSWLGPKEPMHPPITFAQIIKYFLVSIALSGPTA